MKRAIVSVFKLAILASVVVVASSTCYAAKQYDVVVGLNYGPGQNWAPDAVNVSNALAAADPNAVITTLSGNATGVGAITPGGVLAAIAADAGQAQAGDSFTFYYSGHGTYFGNPANPDLVGPSLNPCTEALFFSNALNPLAGMITESDLTTALQAFNAGVNKLNFLDACFAGGFWYGPGVAGPPEVLSGSLAIVQKDTLIAAAGENATAPGNSQITMNWIADINANGFNLTNMNAAQLTAMYNRIDPGAIAVPGNQPAPPMKSPPGFPAPSPDNYYPYQPGYYPMPHSDPNDPNSPYIFAGGTFFTNVPEPGTFVLAIMAVSLVIVARLRTARFGTAL